MAFGSPAHVRQLRTERWRSGSITAACAGSVALGAVVVSGGPAAADYACGPAAALRADESSITCTYDNPVTVGHFPRPTGVSTADAVLIGGAGGAGGGHGGTAVGGAGGTTRLTVKLPPGGLDVYVGGGGRPARGCGPNVLGGRGGISGGMRSGGAGGPSPSSGGCAAGGGGGASFVMASGSWVATDRTLASAGGGGGGGGTGAGARYRGRGPGCEAAGARGGDGGGVDPVSGKVLVGRVGASAPVHRCRGPHGRQGSVSGVSRSTSGAGADGIIRITFARTNGGADPDGGFAARGGPDGARVDPGVTPFLEVTRIGERSDRSWSR